ncbi:MAG: PQQ-dependent sugar dehydrogenase [Planctomycetota bacterium]|nr:PQQ-dependent sugar dehydrogenase [Planctomycetota bacterium]
MMRLIKRGVSGTAGVLLLSGAASCQPIDEGPVALSGLAPAAQGWTMTVLAGGLEHPWGLAFLPGDEGILITERPGRIRLFKDGALRGEPIGGVPPVLASRQGGLLDIALDPDFARTRLVYLTYAHGTVEKNNTRVARARFDGSTLSDLEVVFDVTPHKRGGLHFGSRMQFMPDGSLLVGLGDGFNYRDQAQDVGSHLGKIVRLRPEGGAFAGNPFADRGGALAEVYSYGHRNIQGLALDRASGRVWATEHGPLGGDELNLIEPGKNYGWPLATYGREYHGPRVSQKTSLPGMEDPKIVWTPVLAASGLMVYSGEAFPQWKGDIFAGGLMTREIRRIDIDASGNIGRQESIAIQSRVRDVREGPDGMIYVVTDEADGKLIRVSPK